MKIRFFNTYDTAAPFFRNLLPYLASQGHSIELVISRGTYRQGSGLDEALGGHPNIRIVRTFNAGLQPVSSLKRIGVMATYLAHATLRELFGPSVDRNVFLTQPPLLPFWGYVLSRIRRRPYYCVLQDVYPDLLAALGVVRREALWTRAAKRLMHTALRNAEGVVVIGRCMAERIQAEGIAADKVHFILNWCDERQILPIPNEQNAFRRSQPWAEKFTVLYAGNIGNPQYFDDLIEAADRLQNRTDLAFLFVGGGARLPDVRAEVEKRGLKSVHFYPYLHEKHPLTEILGAGDLHFVTLKDSCVGLAVPSKAYSSLAAGRPILYQGDSRGEIARLVREEGIGAALPCGDPAGLERAILRYLEDPETTRQAGLKARRLAETSQSRGKSLRQYSELLEN